MDTGILLTIIGTSVAFISSMILWVLNSLQKRLDKQESAIEKIQDSLSELKSSIRNREDETKFTVLSRIDAVEKGLHKFQTMVLGGNVTKEECRTQTVELKAEVLQLEKALKEVDTVTREQSLILARIDQAVRSL